MKTRSPIVRTWAELEVGMTIWFRSDERSIPYTILKTGRKEDIVTVQVLGRYLGRKRPVTTHLFTMSHWLERGLIWRTEPT